MATNAPSAERIEEIKTAVATVLDAIVSRELPVADYMQMMCGATVGRTAVELATIAYSTDGEAKTIEEVLMDAGVRGQMLRNKPTMEEMILILQDHYRREAKLETKKKTKRMPVTASAKLSALGQLRDSLGMRFNRASSYANIPQPAAEPKVSIPSDKNIVTGWGTAVPAQAKTS